MPTIIEPRPSDGEPAPTLAEYEMMQAELSAMQELARQEMIEFVQYVNREYVPNWHHRVLCEYLMRWIAGKITRLMVFMPPQHGKSELVSRHLPPFIFGRKPNSAVIATSYASSLASAMNRDVQRVMDSDHYLELFPDTRLYSNNVRTMAKGNWLRNSDEFEIVGKKGYYRCAGIGGGITGRGFNYGIIDDPLKDRASADSARERIKMIDWYNAVFRTRRRDTNAGILITMTRWHEDDLAGRLLQMAEDNEDVDQWVVLLFPAICEEEGEYKDDPRLPGEALWPECGDMQKFPEKEMEKTRISIGPYQWSALYRQKPTPLGGGMFPSDCLHEFEETHVEGNRKIVLPAIEGTDEDRGKRVFDFKHCYWFQCCDTALEITEDAAYTVVGTFGLNPDLELLVYDVWRERLEVPEQYEALMKLRKGMMIPLRAMQFREWLEIPPIVTWDKQLNSPLLFQAVEKAASGIGLVQTAALQGNPFRVLTAQGSKVQRASSVATMAYQNKVYLRSGQHWLAKFIEELTKFPGGKYVDQVDVLAYAGQLVTHDAIVRGVTSNRQLAYVSDTTEEQHDHEREDVAVIQVGGRTIEVDFGSD